MQTRFFAARYGIYHLFRTLQSRSKGVVLVPDYHHGNEVRAIRAVGAPIRFYTIRRNLQPDIEELEQMCEDDVRVLYIIHYLGWPQPVEEIAALCRRRGILLVEDCALSLLSEVNDKPLGSFGDYSIFCLYKTLPVPNGGLLVQNRNVFPDLIRMPLNSCGPSSVVSRSAELMLERLRCHANGFGEALFALKRTLGGVSRGLGAQRVPIGNSGFDWSHLNIRASAFSNFLLQQFDYREICQRRRDNYVYLANQLDGKATALFPSLDEGVCPLFFPILVREKQAAAHRLWEQGIGAVEFWNEGDSEAVGDRFSHSLYLRKHVLELPIHQDVSSAQLEHIAREALKLELM